MVAITVLPRLASVILVTRLNPDNVPVINTVRRIITLVMTDWLRIIVLTRVVSLLAAARNNSAYWSFIGWLVETLALAAQGQGEIWRRSWS